MIRPLSPVSEPKYDFCATDIENNPDGSVIAIDTCWRENDLLQHKVFTTWGDWWSWIKKQARTNRKFRTVYAHNGGGWDWLSFVYFLMFEDKDSFELLDACCAGSKLINLHIKVFKKCTIHFCDSLQLLRSGLDKLGLKFLGQGKLNLEGKLPHEILAENPDLFFAYLANDTETLLLILEKALILIRENVAGIGSLGYTVGGTALKIFKTVGLENEITIPWNTKVKNFLRQGYKGGRVELFKPGYYEDVNVYDINSLYPYAMMNSNVPVSSEGCWVNEFYPGECGAYKIKFNQKNRDIPAVLLIGGKGVYEGEEVYFNPEIELLKEVDPTGEIKFELGYVFQEQSKIFEKFVSKLYALRQTNKDGPIDLLAKYFLNSLYGKFGQHSIRKRIVVLTPEMESELEKENPKTGSTPDVFPFHGNEDLAVVQEDTACEFEHVGIAGIITSNARCILYRGILNAGKDRVIYCDTDSVHMVGKMDSSIINSNIGAFKLEFSGEAAYAGKKLYALRNAETEKVRCKGVSIGRRNGCNISFIDIFNLTKGAEITVTFKQPTTPNQVFSGQKPCVFGERKRTIRMLNLPEDLIMSETILADMLNANKKLRRATLIKTGITRDAILVQQEYPICWVTEYENDTLAVRFIKEEKIKGRMIPRIFEDKIGKESIVKLQYLE